MGGEGKKKVGEGVVYLSDLQLDQQLVVHVYNSAVSVKWLSGSCRGWKWRLVSSASCPVLSLMREQDKPPEREEKTAKGRR